MLVSYRNDVTPVKSAGVGFRLRARSIDVTLTYLIARDIIGLLSFTSLTKPEAKI